MSLLLEIDRNEALKRKLRASPENIVYTIGILRKLKTADISTLNNRVICQKLVYFADRLNVSPHYCYNLYVHGPYSPDLASDLFALSDKFDQVPIPNFISDETARNFNKLTDLFESCKRDTRCLEIVATLDFMHIAEKSKDRAEAQTKRLKGASEEELLAAKELLKSVGLW